MWQEQKGLKGLSFPTRETPIGPLRDPVLFVDAIPTALARQDSWTMPLSLAYGELRPQPSRDALTPLGLAVLNMILTRRCSTMIAVERDKAILVPHEDGWKNPEPGRSLTAPESRGPS